MWSRHSATLCARRPAEQTAWLLPKDGQCKRAWDWNADTLCSSVVKKGKAGNNRPIFTSTWRLQEGQRHRLSATRHTRALLFWYIHLVTSRCASLSAPSQSSDPQNILLSFAHCTWFSAEPCERGYTCHPPRTSSLRSPGCQTPSSKTVRQSGSHHHLAIRMKITKSKDDQKSINFSKTTETKSSRMTTEFRPLLYIYSNTVKRDVVNVTRLDQEWENDKDQSLTVTLCCRRCRLQMGSTCALLWHAEEAQRFLFTR